jgi:hypothetical protein
VGVDAERRRQTAMRNTFWMVLPLPAFVAALVVSFCADQLI